MPHLAPSRLSSAVPAERASLTDSWTMRHVRRPPPGRQVATAPGTRPAAGLRSAFRSSPRGVPRWATLAPNQIYKMAP